MTRPDLDQIEQDINDNVYAHDGGTDTQPLTDLLAYARELEEALADCAYRCDDPGAVENALKLLGVRDLREVVR